MHNDNYIVLNRLKQNIVTLAEAKRYLRIEANDTDDDDIIFDGSNSVVDGGELSWFLFTSARDRAIIY